jgi:hypothetical protein
VQLRRLKPSPSSLIAISALFIALGGTAIAANRYLITSASQIKPSVLSSLTEAPQSSVRRVLTHPVTISAGAATPIAQAECAPDEHVVSGGYAVELAPGAYVSQNIPTGRSWLVQVNATKSSGASTVQAVVVCEHGRVGVHDVAR